MIGPSAVAELPALLWMKPSLLDAGYDLNLKY